MGPGLKVCLGITIVLLLALSVKPDDNSNGKSWTLIGMSFFISKGRLSKANEPLSVEVSRM